MRARPPETNERVAEARSSSRSNNCGDFPGDEEIFASTAVRCIGQALGVIVAETRPQAQAAAAVVVVTYGPPS